MTMAESKKISPYDELVESVTTYVPQPVLLHGYILPFICLYVGKVPGFRLCTKYHIKSG